MAAPQSSRTSTRSSSAGLGGATAASFHRASSAYGARSSSYAGSSCPHHPQQQYHQQPHHHSPPSHRYLASSSFANLGSSHRYYASSPSAFASSTTSSSFLSSSSSGSAVPSLFHHHPHNQRHASPTRVNLVTAGAPSSAAAPSVRFSLDSRSISPHNRPIAVAPTTRRDLRSHHHQHHQPPHHHYQHSHPPHSHHHDPNPHLHHHHHHGHHQVLSGAEYARRPISASGPQHGHPTQRRMCMCSPTTHPGSFRCSLHKAAAAASFGGSGGPTSYSSPSNRLNARRSAMTNSLVRIGTVEGDLVRRALAALIRPSSHQLRRRADFQPRPSRLSVMSRAGEEGACATAA